MNVLSCSGITNHDEYSLVRDLPEAEREKTLTLKRDKSIAKDQKKMDEMKRKLHTDDECKSSNSIEILLNCWNWNFSFWTNRDVKTKDLLMSMSLKSYLSETPHDCMKVENRRCKDWGFWKFQIWFECSEIHSRWLFLWEFDLVIFQWIGWTIRRHCESRRSTQAKLSFLDANTSSLIKTSIREIRSSLIFSMFRFFLLICLMTCKEKPVL